MAEHDGITLDDLYGQQRDIAELIGIDNYVKLVKRYSGEQIYICKYNELTKIQRDRKIRAAYTGYNAAALAHQYDLSVRQIQQICSGQLPGQMCLFDAEN